MTEFRNAKYNRFGSIDVEFNHPQFGWIPFTATSDDVEEHGKSLYSAILSAGNIAPYEAPTADEARAMMRPLTPRQLRLALVRSGKSLLSVTAALDALPEGPAKEEAEIEWEYATQFNRLAPALLTIADAIGFTPSEVDALWEQALTI